MSRIFAALSCSLLALSASGCDTDTFEPPDQGPCTVTSDCPVGYVCEEERCILESNADAASLDAGSDAGSGDGSGEGSGG